MLNVKIDVEFRTMVEISFLMSKEEWNGLDGYNKFLLLAGRLDISGARMDSEYIDFEIIDEEEV